MRARHGGRTRVGTVEYLLVRPRRVRPDGKKREIEATNPDEPALSVVVPVRNEATRLPAAIDQLHTFLKEHEDAEVVLAVDVTSTDATPALAEGYASERLRIVPVAGIGKGRAVITGVEAARGRIVVTADTDMAVAPKHFPALAEVARAGFLTIGSRSVPGSRRVNEPRVRFVIGRLFNLVVRALILPGIRDSQCGFKAFARRDGLDILRDVRALGWVFDVEFLARARRDGIEVREVPVVWHYHAGSTLRPLHDAPGVVRQLFGVWRRLGRQPHPKRP